MADASSRGFKNPQCIHTKHYIGGWSTNTLFLHGFQMEPHLHRSEQCTSAVLQAQLPLRWQVDLHAHFVVGWEVDTFSGSLSYYITSNLPGGRPRRFPSTEILRAIIVECFT